MHTQHYDYSDIGCGCDNYHSTGNCHHRKGLGVSNNKTSHHNYNSGVGVTIYNYGHKTSSHKPCHVPKSDDCHSCKNSGYGHHYDQHYPSTNKGKGSYRKCEYVCPTHNLTATSTPVETTEMSSICDHSCVEHNWNFECTLKDSCCNGQNGINDNGAVSFSNLDSTTTSGVKNLGRYLIVATGDDIAVDVGNFNFNPTGMAVSLWVRTSDIDQDGARLFSKTGTIDNDRESLQSHVVSAQLVLGGGLQFRVKLGSDPMLGTTEWQADNVITANTWHHVVFWYNGCDVKIIVDAIEQPVFETGLGTPFSDVKGQTIFQGDQPVALASQPDYAGNGTAEPQPQPSDPWYRFQGHLDQVVIWNYAIGDEIITALYGRSEGANSVPEVSSVSSASFGCNKVQLKHWTTNLCLETCFVDTDLCTLFNQCGTIALLVTNCGKCRSVIVPETNLNGWPGSLETLESKLIENGAKRIYTLRLGLDLNHCPVYLNPCDQVDFVINRGNFIKTPTPDFVITGKEQ